MTGGGDRPRQPKPWRRSLIEGATPCEVSDSGPTCMTSATDPVVGADQPAGDGDLVTAVADGNADWPMCGARMTCFTPPLAL